MKLPKTVYIKVEHDREPEDDFLIASDDPGNLSEPESTIEVGEYQQVRIVKLTNKSYIEEN